MMNSSDGITEHLDPAVTARSDGETQVDPDPPTSRGHGKDGYSIPRYCSLEGITEITKMLQGLELETLARFAAAGGRRAGEGGIGAAGPFNGDGHA